MFTFLIKSANPSTITVKNIIKVERALISGVTPNFTMEKTLSGKVTLPGPATKN